MFVETTTTIPMVDSSYWNTYDATLDFSRAAAAGVKVNLIRLGKGVEGLSTDWGLDRTIGPNISATLEAGMKAAFYWRLYAPWQETGRSQAQRTARHFLDIKNRFPEAMSAAPLVLDIEEDFKDGSEPDIGSEKFAHWVSEYRTALAAEGISNIAVYTRGNFWDSRLNSLHWGDVPMGIAHWVKDETGSIADFSSTNANTWDETAWRLMPQGPTLPRCWSNTAWWQLAPAKIGVELGFSSEKIDINILRQDVYESWFGV